MSGGLKILLLEAESRGIPWIRIASSVVVLGRGRHQRRLLDTITDRTSFIAVQISSDKHLTNGLLAHAGLPVPREQVVTTAKSAIQAADTFGVAVVVKPRNSDFGRGISVNLTEAHDVEAAFEKARHHSKSIIVEEYVDGDDHRLLVVDGKMIAAAKRTPGHVIGDGRRSVRELADEVNRARRSGPSDLVGLERLEIETEAEVLLSRVGMTAESVPPSGMKVFLRGTANLSTGGSSIDVTDLVHPETRAMAVSAVANIGLDVAGVDFLTPDIARSFREVGGGICEVNCRPNLRVHCVASGGRRRNVAKPIIDYLFPETRANERPIVPAKSVLPAEPAAHTIGR